MCHLSMKMVHNVITSISININKHLMHSYFFLGCIAIISRPSNLAQKSNHVVIYKLAESFKILHLFAKKLKFSENIIAHPKKLVNSLNIFAFHSSKPFLFCYNFCVFAAASTL